MFSSPCTAPCITNKLIMYYYMLYNLKLSGQFLARQNSRSLNHSLVRFDCSKKIHRLNFSYKIVFEVHVYRYIDRLHVYAYKNYRPFREDVLVVAMSPVPNWCITWMGTWKPPKKLRYISVTYEQDVLYVKKW